MKFLLKSSFGQYTRFQMSLFVKNQFATQINFCGELNIQKLAFRITMR
ncbi:hypothetical protein [Candidatus Lariskella endosymbiont of Epinotia ramella]